MSQERIREYDLHDVERVDLVVFFLVGYVELSQQKVERLIEKQSLFRLLLRDALNLVV